MLYMKKIVRQLIAIPFVAMNRGWLMKIQLRLLWWPPLLELIIGEEVDCLVNLQNQQMLQLEMQMDWFRRIIHFIVILVEAAHVHLHILIRIHINNEVFFICWIKVHIRQQQSISLIILDQKQLFHQKHFL